MPCHGRRRHLHPDRHRRRVGQRGHLHLDAASSSICSISGAGAVSFDAVGTCTRRRQPGRLTPTTTRPPRSSRLHGEQGQPDDHLHLDGAGRPPSAAPPTPRPPPAARSGNAVTFTVERQLSTSAPSTAAAWSASPARAPALSTPTRPANTNYNAAPQVQQSVTVAKAQPDHHLHLDGSGLGNGRRGHLHRRRHRRRVGQRGHLQLGLHRARAPRVAPTARCSPSSGAGTCVVDANQAGYSNYNAAPQVQQSSPCQGQPDDHLHLDGPVRHGRRGHLHRRPPPAAVRATLSPSARARPASAPRVAPTARCSPSSASGTCIVNANQAGNTNYNAAPRSSRALPWTRATRRSPSPRRPRAGHGRRGHLHPDRHRRRVGQRGHLHRRRCQLEHLLLMHQRWRCSPSTPSGTCTVDANQAGYTNYNAATQVQQSVTVAKGSQTITFTSTAPVTATVGGATYTAAATGGGSGNAVTFSSGSTSVVHLGRHQRGGVHLRRRRAPASSTPTRPATPTTTRPPRSHRAL